ncbi:hypothetical protein EQV77_05865 [Halobacillus fulvus]|nr:hypothetical protein EQV77_05865 [Halobacillus fulvus]
MADVFDFDVYKTKQMMKKKKRPQKLVYEIYLTAIQFIDRNIESTYDDPVEHLTTDMRLEEIYQGDYERFLATFASLAKYWGIDALPHAELTRGEPFGQIKTIGDLCHYVEKRVKSL